MNESQLVRTIKAHIERGDKAKDKAEQHYIDHVEKRTDTIKHPREVTR